MSYGTFMGLRVVLDYHMVHKMEDWSGVRSPSRAKRRMKRGFPQNIVYYTRPKEEYYITGDVVVMHPEMYKKLLRETATLRDPIAWPWH